MSLDLDLKRLMEFPDYEQELSMQDAADILKISVDSVRQAIHRNTLAAKLHTGRGRGSQRRVRISKAAVIAYLVKITAGDKTALLASIQEICPQFIPVAQAALQPGPAATTEPPANVIPFKRPRKSKHFPADPCPGHPDLSFRGASPFSSATA